jgi:hypothetical protein
LEIRFSDRIRFNTLLVNAYDSDWWFSCVSSAARRYFCAPCSRLVRSKIARFQATGHWCTHPNCRLWSSNSYCILIKQKHQFPTFFLKPRNHLSNTK